MLLKLQKIKTQILQHPELDSKLQKTPRPKVQLLCQKYEISRKVIASQNLVDDCSVVGNQLLATVGHTYYVSRFRFPRLRFLLLTIFSFYPSGTPLLILLHPWHPTPRLDDPIQSKKHPAHLQTPISLGLDSSAFVNHHPQLSPSRYPLVLRPAVVATCPRSL